MTAQAENRDEAPAADMMETSAGSLQALHHVGEIANCSHGAEILGSDFAARKATYVIHQVHYVDAVDFQILKQSRLWRDAARFESEQLDERGADALENLVVSVHDFLTPQLNQSMASRR